jgi:sulfur-oxidizing protein SoxX
MAGLFLGLGIACAASAGAAADEASVEAGRLIAEDRRNGNCYSCHMVQGAELAGNSGPPLMMMKQRYPDRDVLLAQIADPRVRNPNTIMPPYGAHGILTEQELSLVVDYLLSL